RRAGGRGSRGRVGPDVGAIGRHGRDASAARRVAEPAVPCGGSVRREGFELTAVLGTLLVVGVISFAMGLVASTESLAARSAAGAVEARALAEGAVALALAEAREQATAEAPFEAGSGSSIVYGPWAAAGIDATATLTTLAAAGDGEEGAPGGVLLL